MLPPFVVFLTVVAYDNMRNYSKTFKILFKCKGKNNNLYATLKENIYYIKTLITSLMIKERSIYIYIYIYIYMYIIDNQLRHAALPQNRIKLYSNLKYNSANVISLRNIESDSNGSIPFR
jgi:hypothetical protein